MRLISARTSRGSTAPLEHWCFHYTWPPESSCRIRKQLLVKGIPVSVEVDEGPISAAVEEHLPRILLGSFHHQSPEPRWGSFSTSFNMQGLLDPKPQQGSKLPPKSPSTKTTSPKHSLSKSTAPGSGKQCSQCGKPGTKVLGLWGVQDDGILLRFRIVPKSTLEKA